MSAITKCTSAGLGNGQRCACGEYHYTCDECGKNCTSGTKFGPATTALDGITRCYACHEKYTAEQARLIAAAPDLLEACKLALGWLSLASAYLPKSLTTAKVAQGIPVLEVFQRTEAAIKKAEGR